MKKFQEDFKKFAGTYIYESLYKTDEYTITIKNSDWTFSIDETSEDFEPHRHSNPGIEYEFEIRKKQKFNGYSKNLYTDYYEINSRRDVLTVGYDTTCKKKK